MARNKQESKKPSHLIQVEFPMFADAKVDFYVGDFDSLVEDFDMPTEQLSSTGYGARTVWNEGRENVLLVHVASPEYHVIAHEAVHCANRILNYIGHEPSNTNDEVMAYIVGFLVKCVERHFAKGCS